MCSSDKDYYIRAVHKRRNFIPLLGWNGKQPYQTYRGLTHTTLEEDTHRKQNFVTLKKNHNLTVL